MVPYDADAELAVVAAMLSNLHDRQHALIHCTEQDFYVPTHRLAFAAIAADHERGDTPDTANIIRRVNAAGGRLDLKDLLAQRPVFIDADLRRIRELALRRALGAAGEQVTALALDPKTDPELLPTEVDALLHSATQPLVERDELINVFDLAESEHVDHDWIVPYLVERGDRLLLTGYEGGGKSTALRSWGMMLALGLHPFTLQRVAPVRVLLVDLENSLGQLARSFNHLCRLAPRGAPRENMVLRAITSGLDVRDPRGRERLDLMIGTHEAQLVVLGPLYKAFRPRGRESKADETAAEDAAYALDRIRERHGCALWIEAHPPHGESNDRAGLRPYGASLWLRWPEFGFGMKPVESIAGRPGVELVAWRGARSRTHRWPRRLYEGVDWPWIAEGYDAHPNLDVAAADPLQFLDDQRQEEAADA